MHAITGWQMREFTESRGIYDTYINTIHNMSEVLLHSSKQNASLLQYSKVLAPSK